MRVISGRQKGRKLKAVEGKSTRPTTDRIKESLFSILSPDLDSFTFLDLFAGSGAIGIEALSRALNPEEAKVIFVEENRQALETIKANLTTCEFTTSEQIQVKNTDALSFIRKTAESFDIVFIDPPQFQNLPYLCLEVFAGNPELLKPDGKLICKMHPSEYETFESDQLEQYREKKYGSNLLVFFRKKVAGEQLPAAD